MSWLTPPLGFPFGEDARRFSSGSDAMFTSNHQIGYWLYRGIFFAIRGAVFRPPSRASDIAATQSWRTHRQNI
jgi:hypothetical protein